MKYVQIIRFVISLIRNPLAKEGRVLLATFFIGQWSDKSTETL